MDLLHDTKTKKKEEKGSPSPLLPEEVILHIFTWLPLKSLFRFTSVSRRFFSLIADPSFLHCCRSDAEFLLLARGSLKLGRNQVITSTAQTNPKEDLTTRHDFSLDFALSSGLDLYNPYASCDGLVLYLACGYRCLHHVVCNPLTRQWVVISPARFTCPDEVNAGIICDPPTTDGRFITEFKVVLIRSPYLPEELDWSSLDLWTFSSATGEWKETILPFPTPITHDGYPRPQYHQFGAVSHDQRLYFKTGRDDNITVYDPRIEQCQPLPLPHRNSERETDSFLGKSGGRIRFLSIINRQTLSLWVLEEVADKPTWSLEHRVTLQDLTHNNPKWFEEHREKLLLLQTQDSPFPRGMIDPKFHVLGFHPLDPEVVYLQENDGIISCNLQSRKIVIIPETSSDGDVSTKYGRSVPYCPWPSRFNPSSGTHHEDCRGRISRARAFVEEAEDGFQELDLFAI